MNRRPGGGLITPTVEAGVVRLVHRQNGAQSTFAPNVEMADSFLSQAHGLMFRGSAPGDYVLVFRSDDADRHSLHMVSVPFNIDVFWLVDDEVTKKKRLSAWAGIGFGMADATVELPAGAAGGVEPGDLVEIAE